MAKKKEEKKVEMTRAQKTEATKSIIKELLAIKPMRHNELIEETARLYTERYKSEETENVNDVKGRVGSVLDIMKKESEVMYEGGMYALKARALVLAPEEKKEEKPAKKTAKGKTKKAEPKAEEKQEAPKTEVKEEKPAPKKRGKTKKAEEKPEPVKTEESSPATEEKKEEQPVQATAEVTAEEKPAPKKRGRKPKAKAEEAPSVVEAKEEKPEPVVEVKEESKEEKQAETKTEVKEETSAQAPSQEVKTEEKEQPAPQTAEVSSEASTEAPKKEEEKPQAPKKEENALTVKPKAEVAQKGVVMDMSFLIGDVKGKTTKTESKPQKTDAPKAEDKPQKQAKEEKQAPVSTPKGETPKKADEKKEVKAEDKPQQKPQQKEEPKTENKAENKPQKTEAKPAAKQPQKQDVRGKQKQPEKQISADEKLRDAFLKRMRTLGGDYFEYYSVYLLERYSMKNGRRLEGMKISGGGHDGGIDGEIELTDKFGFKETIYIQSKNWDPDKGKEENWVVGETLLQQFIGACACRQAKDGKQHCRGIFVTTSRFTPDAKRILEDMSDKIVGYDGNDL